MDIAEGKKPAAEQVVLHRLDHLTIRTRLDQLEEVREFYEKTLHLKPGDRPNFKFPGYWLYLDGRPVVHLAGTDADLKFSESGSTLGFDHISFRTTGLKAMRQRLDKVKVKYAEAPVPGFPLHQIFFRDPVGMKVELTFDAAENS